MDISRGQQHLPSVGASDLAGGEGVDKWERQQEEHIGARWGEAQQGRQGVETRGAQRSAGSLRQRTLAETWTNTGGRMGAFGSTALTATTALEALTYSPSPSLEGWGIEDSPPLTANPDSTLTQAPLRADTANKGKEVDRSAPADAQSPPYGKRDWPALFPNSACHAASAFEQDLRHRSEIKIS